MAVERGAARCVADIARLSDAMKNFIEQPELLETSAAAARALVSDNRGALVRTLELIDGALADTPRVADQGHD